MKGIALLAALAAGCLAAPGAAAQDAGNDGRDAIVRDLLSGDRGKVNDALGRLPPFADDTPFPEGYVTVELVEALITALEREKRLHDEGREPERYVELNLSLEEAVVATRHPQTVDILTRTMYGTGARDAVLHFGPGVLPGVAELATSPEATPEEANGALWVLWTALERWEAENLAPDIREAMKEAAILYFEGPPDHFASTTKQHFRNFQFDKAAEIAKLLGDPELTAVARKARHPTTGEPGIPPPRTIMCTTVYIWRPQFPSRHSARKRFVLPSCDMLRLEPKTRLVPSG